MYNVINFVICKRDLALVCTLAWTVVSNDRGHATRNARIRERRSEDAVHAEILNAELGTLIQARLEPFDVHGDSDLQLGYLISNATSAVQAQNGRTSKGVDPSPPGFAPA